MELSRTDSPGLSLNLKLFLIVLQSQFQFVFMDSLLSCSSVSNTWHRRSSRPSVSKYQLPSPDFHLKRIFSWTECETTRSKGGPPFHTWTSGSLICLPVWKLSSFTFDRNWTFKFYWCKVKLYNNVLVPNEHTYIERGLSVHILN